MQKLEKELNLDADVNFKKFQSFLELVSQKQSGNFKINQSNFNIKMKIPLYKDCKQIISLYENIFLKSIPSNSKKKSGTILIIWVIIKFSEINFLPVENFMPDQWVFLASLFPNFSQEKLQMRWYSVQKSVEQKCAWNEEEDQALIKLIKEISTHTQEKNYKWTEIAETFNKMVSERQITRLGKHCRERWFNHLDPAIKKGDWTAQEDIKLLETILAQGRKWSQIAKIMESRNENSVKNRFFSLLNKFKKKKNIENDKESIISILKNLKELNPSSISNVMIKKIGMNEERNKRSSLQNENKTSGKHLRSQGKKSVSQKKKKTSLKFDSKSKISQEDIEINIEKKLSSLSLDSPKLKKLKTEVIISNNAVPNISKLATFDYLKDTNNINNNNIPNINNEFQSALFDENKQIKMTKLESKEEIFYKDQFFPPGMMESFANFQFQPNYPANLINPQFPFFYYNMPIFDTINEEFNLNPPYMFKNYINNNEFDLKNISQLVSSMSLSDEYLLEGQKLLSELTFKSNSLSSFQDRLSLILPNSNPSNSSLSKKMFTPTSMLLKNNIQTNDDKYERKKKASRKTYFGRINEKREQSIEKEHNSIENIVLHDKLLFKPTNSNYDQFLKDGSIGDPTKLNFSDIKHDDQLSFQTLNHIE